ncbi:MAG: hypothetical protein PHV71_08105 [Eubacteriales bacterium]|nr:hypothetical protein [Eubacteriales bacterium]MDD4630530.1 hypothetical protein [Eubacteriales bacterium]
MRVFIAGPRAVSKLNKSVEDRLFNIYNNNFTVLVGDANGVDKLIQNFYLKLNYKNVVVYASKGLARNNIGNWPIENVVVANKVRGFDFYTQKDVAMSKSADYGFMIWNGKSKGTLNNVLNLVFNNKKVLVYFIPQDKFILIENKLKLEQLISLCPLETKEIYKKLISKTFNSTEQVSML